MGSRLYLTCEERLRFKKLLERVVSILLRDHEGSLSFQVARRRLSDFIEPFSPISKTRELIQKLLLLMSERPFDFGKKQKIQLLLEELSTSFELKDLSYSMK